MSSALQGWAHSGPCHLSQASCPAVLAESTRPSPSLEPGPPELPPAAAAVPPPAAVLT